MYYLDLIKLLKAQNRSLKNVAVHGRIVSRLNRPSSVPDTVKLDPNGIFVRFDVYAVNLTPYETYLRDCGYSSENNNYMVNGSVVAYVPAKGYVYPEWYTLRGTLASSNVNEDYVSLFKWGKSDSGWFIDTNIIDDLVIDDWSKTGILYAWLEKSFAEQKVMHPDDVLNLRPFYCTIPSISAKPTSLDSSLARNMNNIQAPNVTYMLPKNNYESRQVIKDYSNDASVLQASLENSETSRLTFIKNLKSSYVLTSSLSPYIKFTLDGISNYMSLKPSQNAQTGKALLKKYLDKFGKQASAKYVGLTVSEYLISIFDEVSMYMQKQTGTVMCEGVALELFKSAFYNVERFYCGIISIILGVSYDDLLQVCDLCTKNNISFSRLINENPYALQVISNLTFNEVEHIALCVGRSSDASLKTYKNIAIIHAKINDADDGSTTFNRDRLERSNIGVKVSKAKYDSMKQNGSIISKKMQDNILYYIRNFSGDICYNGGNWISQGYYYIDRITMPEVKVAIDDYLSSGLGIQFNNCITSYNLAQQELNIYNAFYELGKSEVDYKDADIDRYINEYENIVGFKLEKEQRDAVFLLKHRGGIIAGSAGSGKTTVSNCMVYVLNKLDPYVDIKFAAPTGKAAKRMQEVVKKEVKTLNSLFKVYETSKNILEDDENDSIDGEVYFFDEGAMIRLDLLNSVTKKMDIDHSRIYLFGDYHQLPPIGKGLPFKDLLRFMPCVFLTVSKRAADGSDITRNSDYINNFSEYNNWKNLVSGKDFILAPCDENKISELTKGICSHYLGKNTQEQDKQLLTALGINAFPVVPDLTPDDIQVVSPVGKPTYEWGSTRLNSILQPLFNPLRGARYTFVYQPTKQNYTKFTIGDRVIHTDKNMYFMQWYSKYSKSGEFQKTWGFGICNGEVGEIVDIFKAGQLLFLDEVDSEPADFEYPQNIRDDSTFTDMNGYFVVVKYYDYISAKNFYILYRCNETEYDCNYGKSFNGDDLSKLALFYAGTTHKLQGSQSKLIISVLGDVNFKGFITRNMMYTVYTRAEKLVFALGSVANTPNSMLTRARKEVAEKGVYTIGELLNS